MKILFTDGPGFIGSAVIPHTMKNTNDSIINLDKLTYTGSLESLVEATYSNRYAFEQVDICARVELDRIFTLNKSDAAMYLAAKSHVERSIDEPTDFIKTNIKTTYQLLDDTQSDWKQLATEKKSAFIFHHISTDEVYDDLDESKNLFTENTAYSPYSASKAASVHIVSTWFRTYGLPTVISHYSNNHEPYQFSEKLIPLTFSNALEGKPLPIYGNGLQIRNWLYIDVVTAICTLLDELVSVKHSDIEMYDDLITYVADRPRHDLYDDVDVKKIAQVLYWQPKETFENGLRKMVKWYISNKVWWDRILNGSYILKRQGANS